MRTYHATFANEDGTLDSSIGADQPLIFNANPRFVIIALTDETLEVIGFDSPRDIADYIQKFSKVRLFARSVAVHIDDDEASVLYTRVKVR